jgi:hypothetical protein
MATGTEQIQTGSFDRPAPDDVVRFLGAILEPTDFVLVRPIETWTDGNRKNTRIVFDCQRWQRAGFLAKEGPWQSLLKILGQERANAFFGVCPRFGPNGQFDLSWQIRRVRVLWADLDHCTVEEALRRCEQAGLPRPTVVVSSGNGVHLYWALAEPYLIDDVGDPPAVLKEWIERGPEKKKLVRCYIRGEGRQRIYLFLRDEKTGGDSKVHNPECEWGDLSLKARHVQDVLAGLAAKIGGDHTTDLARLLRLPGTLNHKDERNSKEPVPCVLVECDSTRRYPISHFERFAVESPHASDVREWPRFLSRPRDR